MPLRGQRCGEGRWRAVGLGHARVVRAAGGHGRTAVVGGRPPLPDLLPGEDRSFTPLASE